MTPRLNTGANAPGVLVTFEGGDGAGKTTHIAFLKGVLEGLGFDVVHVREPGGTKIGERLRGVVLDVDNFELSSRSELLIYEAARAQLVDEVIRPALEAGAIVLCDRFTDSTIAYQGYGRGLDRGFIEAANNFATDGIEPDVTIMLTCPNRAEKRSRIDRRDAKDRLELAGDDFHTRVIDAFGEIASANPRIKVIETSGRHSQTAMKIFEALRPQMPWLTDGAVDLADALAEYDIAHDSATRSERHAASGVSVG